MKKLLLAGCLALLLTAAVVTVAAARGGNGNGKKSRNRGARGLPGGPVDLHEAHEGEIKLKVNGELDQVASRATAGSSL